MDGGDSETPMAERPLLAMPRPERQTPTAGRWPIESIPAADPTRQAGRVGPKFTRLAETLGDPQALGDLRDDPSAIVPERALVFEVASEVVDFYRAARGVPSLEFLGEDEGDAVPDEDFFIPGRDGAPREDKRVPRRFYFTIPDQTALRELLSLWQHYQRGDELGRGRTAWRDVFGHLADIRPWGPRDRLTIEAIEDWRERLEMEPDKPVRFEVEFWYRDNASRRETTEATFTEKLAELEGQVLDRIVIDSIRYHAVLIDVAPSAIHDMLNLPNVGLVAFDDVMVLRPQSMVSGPVDGTLEDTTEAKTGAIDRELEAPVAALLDGVPMAQHDLLVNQLVVDDPDEYADQYGTAAEQRHGTAMASLILHGDLNTLAPQPPIRRQLYVRPVMYSQPDGFNSTCEVMPPDRLSIDLIWRAFIRMFDGEGSEDPTAPTVRIVNLSLGDAKRRFAGVMSPWARLIDYLAWQL